MRLAAKVAVFEFVDDEVRLALVKTGGKRPKALELHACRAEYEDPEGRFEALVQAAETVVANLKTKPTAHALCVSSFYSVVRSLTIPLTGKRRVAATVQFELERYLAFPIEELLVDFFPLLEVEKQTEVLAVGVRRAVLEEQLAVLQAAGVEPEGIDLDALGLTGLWRASRPSVKGLGAVLHVRTLGSVLAIVDGKKLVYFRHLGFTAEEVHERPVAVAREVSNSLRAFHGNWRGAGDVGFLAVTGAGFFEEERGLFESELDVPVTYESLAGLVVGYPEAIEALAAERGESAAAVEHSGEHNRWTAAIGVALGAAGTGYAMRFREPEPARKDVARRLVPHVMFTSCLLLLLLLGVAWYYRDGRNRNLVEAENLRAQIAGLENEVSGLQGQGINVPMGIFCQPSLLDILDEIGAKIPNDKATVANIQVDLSSPRVPWITVLGTVKDDAGFNAAFKELGQSTLFDVDPDPGLELDRGVASFRIVGRQKGPGAAGA